MRNVGSFMFGNMPLYSAQIIWGRYSCFSGLFILWHVMRCFEGGSFSDLSVSQVLGTALLHKRSFCLWGPPRNPLTTLVAPRTPPWEPLLIYYDPHPLLAGSWQTGGAGSPTVTGRPVGRNRSLFCAVLLRRRRSLCLSSFAGWLLPVREDYFRFARWE